MDKVVKRLWVLALRSGEYQKGGGQLYDDHTARGACHCVLGVLCEEAAKVDVVQLTDQPGNRRFGDVPDYSLVPAEVAVWARLGQFEQIEAKVARMNDSSDMSFDELADYIEENF